LNTQGKKNQINLLSKEIVLEAIKESFKMLTPQVQLKNPVMFVTYLGAILTSLYLIHETWYFSFSSFHFQLTLWLWFTVLFANFAQSVAESRGKAQASFLRKTQCDTTAILIKDSKEETISSTELRKGDLIKCSVGSLIPVDGEIIKGIATIDESAITGESAPVIRESGGDRSAVTAGTKVISDEIIVKVTSEQGHSFLDRMISLVEGATRQKTPNEIALNIVLSALTIIFLLTVSSLKIFSDFSEQEAHQSLNHITLPVLVALLVCLIPTTISALINAIGIAGMDRLIRRNVIAKSGRAIEAAGDIDLLLLDKTGTITLGNRMAYAFIPASEISEKDFALIAQQASLSDETPEGRSIVVLAKTKFQHRGEGLENQRSKFIPFSSQSRMSGIDFLDDQGQVIRSLRKGASDTIRSFITALGGAFPLNLDVAVETVAHQGGTPLVVCDGKTAVGVIHLKDIIKGGIKERFAKMRKMGIKTLMITGDNPRTAAAIAAEAGVDDFLAEATPEAKLARIRQEQEGGRLVAMAGDGTNDAPALAQADVGVAMNTGTQASREAGNMVDLDSNPTKLIEIVEIGKQLLITRGALTTFSIANDVAKYFAIIPAIFGSLYLIEGDTKGPLTVLNIMGLHSHESAILSAVIFNALIIIALIPLALRGVSYKPESAEKMLRSNLLLYGVGGIIAPFIGIKLIDLIVIALGAVV
jgi:potassium-transporting ATPase ATP-binding subunit